MELITDVNSIKKRLKQSGLTKEMVSLENCKFLIIIEHEGKIIGASGVGGLFHVPSLAIHPNYVKKGLGVRLFDAVIKEAKKRNYSFLSGSRDPKNLSAVRIHDYFELHPIFQINYSPEFKRDVVFMRLNNKGKLFENFFKLFNNIIGITILVIFLKIFKKLMFRSLLTLSPDEFPSSNVRYAIKNFKKLPLKNE